MPATSFGVASIIPKVLIVLVIDILFSVSSGYDKASAAKHIARETFKVGKPRSSKRRLACLPDRNTRFL